MKLQIYTTIHLGSSKLLLWRHKGMKKSSTIWPFHSQDIFSNSPYCLSYNSYDTGTDNLVLDQLASSYTTLLKFETNREDLYYNVQ